MMRLPRVFTIFTIACGLAAPLPWSVARADDASTPPPPASNDTTTPPPAGDTATPPPSNGTTTPPAPAAGDATTPPAPAAGDTTTPPSPAAGDTTTPPAAGSGDNTTAPPAATDNTSAGADTTEAPAKPTLDDLVDTYWHYGKVARYDVAADAGQKILDSGSDNSAILMAFEAVAARHNDVIDTWMLRWRGLPTGDVVDRAGVEAMRKVSAKLDDILNQGYADRRSDPNYIRQTVYEMARGSRAYDNNLPRLSQSGEVAIKIVLDILRDPQQAEYHSTCRRIMVDLGRKALNPLLASTEMKDYGTLVDVISALGSLGYDASVPYLARLADLPDAPSGIHVAARKALDQIGLSRTAPVRPSDLFFDLAEKCYYGKSDIVPAGDKVSYIWYWSDDKGLTRTQVPTPIFNDLQAMRCTEYTMKLDPSNGRAVSLWLAANTKREADLPAGAVDLTHKNDPDANYYNVSAGTVYLNDALARATRDRNAAVALKLCESLRNITGQSSLSNNAVTPLMQALYFPNRQVRYAAAFALAASLPTAPFSGSDRVVPLLVEAVNQTSKPGILVVAPDTSTNGSLTAADLRDAVQSLGYPVVAASTPNNAAAAAISMPTVELIVISEDSDVRRMVELEQTIARLQGASVLVLTHAINSPYAQASATNLLMNAALMPQKATLKDELKADIDAAREHSGTAVLSEEDASKYSLDAADLLEKLALTHGHAFDMTVAEGGLLQALNDQRPAIAKATGHVLATLRTASAQNGLAMKANNGGTPSEVRVSLYESLADSAKHFGNHLQADQVENLEQTVSNSTDGKVRDAAAEARGALDLPADAARTLILKQSRM
jgi:hypothetical protein